MITRRTLLATVPAAALGLGVTGLFAGGHGRQGTFVGKSNHVTLGTVEVVEQNGQTIIDFKSDFDFDGAPDPKVALGNNGYDKSTLMGALKADKGAQQYVVPASIDASAYNEVWIWCERFNVPLGVATLG
ncbi:MAG: DM13 domain-containing protein [Pseudomonadota bacterium]